MSGVDWGTGSDILAAVSGGLSAIGSFFAIGLTGWLAYRERQRADRLRDQAIDLEVVRRYEVVQAALGIIERIEFLHNRFADGVGETTYSYDSSVDGYRRDVSAECDKLISLKSFAGQNPVLSTALENMASTHRVPEGKQMSDPTRQMMWALGKAGTAKRHATDIQRHI